MSGIRLWSVAGALVMAVAAAAQAVPGPPAEDLLAGPPSGPWRRLLLDAMVVERQEGLRRVFHAATKHPGNPVLKAEQPWESPPSARGPYLYGTVMWDEGKLRMWYHAYGEGGYRNLYAESADGTHWTRPPLGLVDFRGSRDNNLFLTGSDEPEVPELYQGGGKCHNPSVIKRPWEPDPEKRYALFCYAQEYRHARAAFSPDGLRWTFVPETARTGLFSSSDVLSFFHDPYQNRYVATWKAGSRRGRAVGVATSGDGLKWTKPVEGPVFVADDNDPDATQVYGMPVFPYQGLYVGLPWIYNARWFKIGGYSDQALYEAEKDSPCTIDVQLAWSWDLINWTRPPGREQFIPRGPQGAFDESMIYTARAPVQVGDELYFYYGGFDRPHNDPQFRSAIGLAALRLDGFCSLQAGEQEGWFISRRERLHLPRVTINARTAPDGYVVAEVLDIHDQVIPGFSREDCRAYQGDAVRHELTWTTERFPEDLVGAHKKLRFTLRRADLYSYLPDTTPQPRTVLWDPVANGGRMPDDPSLPAAQAFSAPGKPGGYALVAEAPLPYLDLHSAGGEMTAAAYYQDAEFDDRMDWCLEIWVRVVDRGDEPNYGLACFMRPDHGRGGALYLGEDEVGILSTDQAGAHHTLTTAPCPTTDAFHWLRLVHEGGADGWVRVEADGQEKCRLPFTDLFMRADRGYNVSFGPNAANREGRLHAARFGYRLGSTEPLLGPVPGP